GSQRPTTTSTTLKNDTIRTSQNFRSSMQPWIARCSTLTVGEISKQIASTFSTMKSTRRNGVTEKDLSGTVGRTKSVMRFWPASSNSTPNAQKRKYELGARSTRNPMDAKNRKRKEAFSRWQRRYPRTYL